MTELQIDDATGLAGAAHDAAERGDVVYLTDASGRRLAAIVLADVAVAASPPSRPWRTRLTWRHLAVPLRSQARTSTTPLSLPN